MLSGFVLYMTRFVLNMTGSVQEMNNFVKFNFKSLGYICFALVLSINSTHSTTTIFSRPGKAKGLSASSFVFIQLSRDNHYKCQRISYTVGARTK